MSIVKVCRSEHTAQAALLKGDESFWLLFYIFPISFSIDSFPGMRYYQTME